MLKDLQNRQAAARELLASAGERMAKPRGIGTPCNVYVAPTADQRQAEAVLAECAELIPRAEQRLAAARQDLAQWEEKKKNFPMAGTGTGHRQRHPESKNCILWPPVYV